MSGFVLKNKNPASRWHNYPWHPVLTHRPPLSPNWTELDTFGHFFGVSPTPAILCHPRADGPPGEAIISRLSAQIGHFWTLFRGCRPQALPSPWAQPASPVGRLRHRSLDRTLHGLSTADSSSSPKPQIPSVASNPNHPGRNIDWAYADNRNTQP